MKPSAGELHRDKLTMDFSLAFQDPGGVALEIISSGEGAKDLRRVALSSQKVEERETGAGVTEAETMAVQPLQEEQGGREKAPQR